MAGIKIVRPVHRLTVTVTKVGSALIGRDQTKFTGYFRHRDDLLKAAAGDRTPGYFRHRDDLLKRVKVKVPVGIPPVAVSVLLTSTGGPIFPNFS